MKLSLNMQSTLNRFVEEASHKPEAWHFPSSLSQDWRTCEALVNRGLLDKRIVHHGWNGVAYRLKVAS